MTYGEYLNTIRGIEQTFLEFPGNPETRVSLDTSDGVIHNALPPIKRVIFNDPATIVLWGDNTKTVVKCQEGDTYDPEKGLYAAMVKKALGNKSNFNNVINKWLPKEEK